MTPFQIAMLGSGSKGNATLMRCGAGTVLIDAGISCRRIVMEMRSLSVDPEELSAVFITHEHIDHIRGLEALSKTFDIPIYASAGTWQGIKRMLPRLDLRLCEYRIFKPGTGLVLGGLQVRSFAVSHDALEPAGYVFTHRQHSFGYVTDTGYISDRAKQVLDGVDALVLETNHDMIMLKDGKYAPSLKKRILGTKGHLANDTAAHFLAGLNKLPEEVFLAHLSHENNTPDLALSTVRGIVARQRPSVSVRYYVTSQDTVVKNDAWEDHYEQNIFE